MTHTKMMLLAAATTLIPMGAVAKYTTVESIDVEVELDTIQNAEAAEYWGELSQDLESAILAELTDQISDDGAKVSVDLDELSLASIYEAAFGVDSYLSGRVNVRNDDDTTVNTFFDLKVTIEQAGIVMPTNTENPIALVPKDTTYMMMVDAFAERVASKVK